MKKLCFFLAVLFNLASVFPAFASGSVKYTVIKGDSMRKIAVKHQIGLDEIKNANPQVVNPELIYPGQLLNIPTSDSLISEYESEVIKLVNEIRQKNGLKPLTADWQLSRVARYKSQDMKENNYFSHNSPVYGTPFEMMKSFGISYKTAGENIAKGQRTPKAVVDSWMNSSGHRANILNKSYKKIGVGYVSGGNYWTQMFTG